MKIGFFGDSIWAQNALTQLLECENYEIMFVVPRIQNPDLRLIDIATKNNIPVLIQQNVNDKDFIDKLKLFEIDLNVSMSFDQIIKKDLLSIAELGFINCHAGALPFYRGRNILNWVLINGERDFGITVHYIDEGIDTGDIILQWKENIENQDTYNDLLNKCYELCPKILLEAIDQIDAGIAKRFRQQDIHPVGFYCGKRTVGDEIINWSWPTSQINNFIRALSFPAPYAQTKLNNKTIKIAKAVPIENAPIYIGTCGEVIGKNDKGVVVKTGDSSILIQEIVDDDNSIPNFSIGSRFYW